MTEGDRPFIAVVSGLPRSGTSMMMGVLSAGGLEVLTDQLRRPDEDNPVGYFELDRVKRLRQDSAWLAEARGKAVKVIYRLLYDLPPQLSYRLVFMERRLEEVVASQKVMLERQSQQGAKLSEDKLVAAFSMELRKVDHWIATQPNMSCLKIDFSAAVKDPLGVSNEVSEFLGGGLRVERMAAAIDPSLYRQRHEQS